MGFLFFANASGKQVNFTEISFYGCPKQERLSFMSLLDKHAAYIYHYIQLFPPNAGHHIFVADKMYTIMTNRTFGKALLVIDIQENLVNPDSRIHMDTTYIDQFFKNVNHTIDVFENDGLPVCYITNEWSNFFLNWVTGNVCKKGAKGVGPDPRLRRVNGKVYKKSTKSALINTELLKALHDWKVSEIVLVGLLAEHCVKATMVDALKNKFKVTVITDALGSKNEKNLSRSLEYYNRKGAALVPAKRIEEWQQNRITA